MASVKSIGHVVKLSTGGYVVRIERYPNGRLLPAPRVIVDTTTVPQPFSSPLSAMDALKAFVDAPRSVKRALPAPEAETQRKDVLTPKAERHVRPDVNPMMDHADEHARARRERNAKRKALPQVEKLMPAEKPTIVRSRPSLMVGAGMKKVVKVTKLGAGHRANYGRYA